MNRQKKHFYEFGPFRIDGQKRLLLSGETAVTLAPKAFDLLMVLVENSGGVIEKDELLKRVWPDQIVEEANLSVNMSALRKALGESPNEHRYIVTVPGRGYRFVADVTVSVDESTDVIVQECTRSCVTIEGEEQEHYRAMETEGVRGLFLTTARTSPRRLRSLAVLTASALVIGLAIGAYYLSIRLHQPSEVIRSVAVLPFKPLNLDANDEYLELGMADTLITKLSNLRQVIVRPTSAVRKYNGLEQDPVTAGRELRVDSVLEGSIQRLGERVRVTVRLLSVQDGTSLWAEKFDEHFTDIFAVQDSISAQVTRALALKLTSEEKQRLTKRYTDNVEAYQLYLKGRYFLSKRAEEEIKKGIQYFQQAIDLDPNYALAFAGLADSYRSLGGVLGFLPPREVYPRAKAATLNALEIDAMLAEAHTALGDYRLDYEWDWSGAEREYQRAIELNPNYAMAHRSYGGYLRLWERFDEAVAERKRAAELDPLTPITVADVGYPLYHARRYDQAIEHYRRALEIDRNFFWSYVWIGQADVQKGMYEEAITEYQTALALSPGNTRVIATLGHAYAAAGKRAEAKQVLDELKGQSKRRYVSPYFIAVIYTGLGEKDQAFAWLEKAYEERHPYLTLLKVEPVLDSLRPDPRFADLLRRIGLN